MAKVWGVNGLVEMNDEQTERIVENLAEVDWDTIDFWELEEIFEDRDPTEFL